MEREVLMERVSLDIMEYTSQHLEAGYSKIYKWCAFESRGFFKDALEVSVTMRSAISRLKARPHLLTFVPFLESTNWTDNGLAVRS